MANLPGDTGTTSADLLQKVLPRKIDSVTLATTAPTSVARCGFAVPGHDPYAAARKAADKPFFLYLAYTIPHANNEEGRRSGNGMQVPSDAPYSDEPWPQPEKNKAAMISPIRLAVSSGSRTGLTGRS